MNKIGCQKMKKIVESNKLVVSILTISFLILLSGIVVGNAYGEPNHSAKETISPMVAATETISPMVASSNEAVTGNAAMTGTVSIPITEEEKTKATNIAINFTINIGIVNPTIVEVNRDEDDEKNLKVKVEDKDSREIIIIVVTPAGEAKQKVQNVQKFTETENSFKGDHVSFQFTKDTITNFAIDGKIIFQSINLGFNSTKVNHIGSELRISDDKNIVIIHDDENGILTESSSENIVALFKPVAEIKALIKGKRVDFTGITGSILSSNPDSTQVVPTITGDTINIAINHGKSTLIVKSTKGGDFDDRVVEGIAENKVGDIINIDADNSHDITAFDVDVSVNKVVQNTINLNVSSDVTSGRIIALRVNKDILKDLNNLRIVVDGNDIPKALDFDDLFKNDKLASLLVIGQNIEILISIPKFSEHGIVITSEAPVLASSTTAETVTETTIAPIPTTAPTPVPTPTPNVPGFTVGLTITALIVVLLRKRNRS